MSMSDRIAVLQSGRIHQLAPPRELYQRPATAFVAEFVGSSNVLRGSLARAAGATAPLVSLRPENITLLEPTEPAPPGHVTIGGVLRDVQFHGASTRYRVDVDGTTLTIAAQNAGGEPLGARAPGASVRLAWAAAAMVPLES
jgi:putative spermidine/putrescine transport system ATP-binding protein